MPCESSGVLRRCLLVAVVLLAACDNDGGQDAAVSAPQDWEGATPITGEEDAPLGVVATADGSSVVFTTGRTLVGENAVRRASVAGGESVVLQAGSESIVPTDALAVDATHVYASYDRDVVRMPIEGGESEVLTSGRPAGIRYLAVHDGFVYWTTYQFRGTADQIELGRVPVAGGEAEQLVVGITDALGRPQFDGDAVLLASPIGELRVVPGSAAEVLVPSEQLGGSPTELAFDDTSLYVTVAGPRRPLRSVPRAGGDPVVLEADLDTAAAMVIVDGQLVGFDSAGLGRPDSVVAVSIATGEVRTLATGRFPGRDLTVVPGRGVAFSADSRVWLVPI